MWFKKNKPDKTFIDVTEKVPDKKMTPFETEKTDVAPVTNTPPESVEKPDTELTTYTNDADKEFKVINKASGELYGSADTLEDAFALASVRESSLGVPVKIVDSKGNVKGEIG